MEEPVLTPARKNPKSRDNFIVIVAVVALTVVALGYLVLSLVQFFREDQRGPQQISSSLENGNNSVFDQVDIGTVAESLVPSVVSVLTASSESGSYTGAGTGVIVSSNGYILTNRHVAEGARRIAIVVDGDEMYEDTTLVGFDPLNDIAFIKINNAGNSFTPAVFGDSKSLQIGQQVIAIGNSLGLYPNTVTAGIISGMGRSITASDGTGYHAERLSDMIQTDAAINQGNSGGPLVNAGGQVIGINTAVATSGQGIGFAIPISSVKGMLKHLLATGRAERAFIGVTYLDLDASVAAAHDLSVMRGAWVYSSEEGVSAVLDDSPAAGAGIRDGDIITHVGETEIGRAGSLSTLIGEYAVGETVELTIIRDGQKRSLSLTLSAAE